MNKGKEFREIAREDVPGLLAGGMHLVAATPALAADWRRRAMPEHAPAAPAPVARSWHEWLRVLMRSHPALPVPLTRMQELALWERVIEADGMADAAAVAGLARLAASGWRLMREYRLQPEDVEGFGEEADALARWVRVVREHLARHHPERALEADLPVLWLAAGGGDAPAGLVLDGFESWTPMQEAVLEALRARGARLMRVAKGEPASRIGRVAAADGEAECRYVAARIRGLLSQDARQRILVLTTQAVDVGMLERALDEALMPEAMAHPLRGMQATSCPGWPLDRWPRIAQALHLLALAGRRQVRLEDASPLLLAPWLAGFPAEHGARAALEARLRRRNAWRLTLGGLQREAKAGDMPRLAEVLQRLEAWERGRRPAAEWARRAHQLLGDAGWMRASLDAGDETPDAHEVRQMNALRDMLQQLAELDAVMPPMPWPDFLSRLRRACAAGELARLPLHPNVTVMPLEDAPGLQCDAVFVMGMDDASFPATTPPHPMLPPALTTRLPRRPDLPGGNAERDYRRAVWLWSQVQAVAPAVECSFARQRDGVEQEPSAFIADLPDTTPEDAAPGLSGASPVDVPDLVAWADAPAVPLPAGVSVGGDTALLRDQSACPFRAFVRHRLRARSLEEAQPGIAPRQKGGLLHVALEHLWGALGDSRRLAAADEPARRALVEAAVAHAWKETGVMLDAAQAAVERARMRELLLDWLRLEQERPPFTVVAREHDASLALPTSGEDAGRLELGLRVDRVDEDAGGRRIVLDYKTGKKQSARDWLEERPPEPQLPAYALALGLGPRDAVAYARLRRDSMGFEGLAGEDVGIPDIRPCDGGKNGDENWNGLRRRWREALDGLAREFLSGRCEVAPRDARACRYCGLEAVCRIGERREASGGEAA